MLTNSNDINDYKHELEERNKELNCLYYIEDALNKGTFSFEDAFNFIIKSFPSGCRVPELIRVRINYLNKNYTSLNFIETPWFISSDIIVQDNKVGNLSVFYVDKFNDELSNLFLPEEEKLLKTVADRLGHFILHNRLKELFKEIQTGRELVEGEDKAEWRIVLEVLRKTDPKLFYSILRKLLHFLLMNGVEGAERLIQLSSIDQKVGDSKKKIDDNRPLPKRLINNYDEYVNAILKLAYDNMPDEQLLAKIQKWLQASKASGLVKALESQESNLEDISDAIRKYFHLSPEKFELSESTLKGLRVSLIRRFFTDQLEYIKIAKEYVKLTDFYDLITNMIFHNKSHGKLGGKSAGLFLANNIIRTMAKENDILKNVKIPKTWFIASDGIFHFLKYNEMEDILSQKHKEIEQVRIEYPHVVQMFKNGQFPHDMLKGLSMALDDFDDRPLIVRSSSLMEDQMGQSFSGKYKSLFLANQGTKKEKLVALLDAVAEVYASTFSPDPIEYRAERSLIDFHEEMGIMIQEVVGTKVGKYFFPSFAGVGFSNNEFRWSPRIKREDGLLRIVPGLGTRAVDRLSDDYPMLVSPGQPNLRVNLTLDEMLKYSPQYIDVINLESNEFETIELDKVIKECGETIPYVDKIMSVNDNDMVRLVSFDTNYKEDHLIATFEGLFSRTDFIKKMGFILNTLQEHIKSPVDIEFAHDGKDIYILQCRPQSYSKERLSAPIPKDIPEDRIVFTAKKYISNGKVDDITHIVYVDPFEYGALPDLDSMKQVGRAVSKLNQILQRRQFILMGPGRWGSRGDIKLGVNVTYSDINNTAMLIEIARKKGNYIPDLSFGTHFFQDLVEAEIQYLPLYPDEPGILFNERFLNIAKNELKELLPEFIHLENVIKVINVLKSTDGLILKVLLNADLDEAISILVKPGEDNIDSAAIAYERKDLRDQSKWRLTLAERIADSLDAKRFGVKAMYLFGSSKRIYANLNSDIDLIVHLEENNKVEELKLWFEGWSLCLSEINYQRTGVKTEGLLDVNFITQVDFDNNTEMVRKISDITNPAKKLNLKKLT